MTSGVANIVDSPKMLDIYKKRKLRMLQEDFKVVLSETDVSNIQACTTLASLDRVSNQIIRKRLG